MWPFRQRSDRIDRCVCVVYMRTCLCVCVHAGIHVYVDYNVCHLLQSIRLTLGSSHHTKPF